jgi:hypothetical protein
MEGRRLVGWTERGQAENELSRDLRLLSGPSNTCPTLRSVGGSLLPSAEALVAVDQETGFDLPNKADARSLNCLCVSRQAWVCETLLF